jgi:AraC-like DNA-binding protein
MKDSKAESYFVVSNPFADDLGNLTILFSGHSQTKPRHTIGPKVVDYYLLHYINSGQGSFTYRGTSYSLSAGDSFVIEPGELIAYESNREDPWRYDWVAFAGDQAVSLIRLAGFTSELPIVSLTANRRKIPVLFRQLRSALKLTNESAKLRVQGLLYLLFSEYGSEQQENNATHGRDAHSEGALTVKRAIHYLSTQYPEDISIESLAEAIGYSRAHLSRIFKRYTQTTPSTYLLRLRVDNARRLLREREELTIEQIASSVGFHDPLYFSKQFKRIYHENPTSYRNKSRAWNQ